MTPPDREPSCAVRGRLAADGHVRLVTRNLALDVAGQTSEPPRAELPSALDLLVAALVADLLGGFRREAARDGVAIHDAELAVSAYLDNPLVALGVVGEEGSPALASVRGAFYVSAESDASSLEALWRRTLERAPVVSTLSRCAELAIDLKPVP